MNIICKRQDCKYGKINNAMQNINICWRETTTVNKSGHCTNFENKYSKEELANRKISWKEKADGCGSRFVYWDKRVVCRKDFPYKLCSYGNCPNK